MIRKWATALLFCVASCERVQQLGRTEAEDSDPNADAAVDQASGLDAPGPCSCEDEPCSKNGDCCSQICVSGKCRHACRENGSDCATSPDCCSNDCREGVCGGRPVATCDELAHGVCGRCVAQ